ncbi:hypothetical protein [Pseudoblastomonas halimionae]|uniref:Uncharacterized protein n=1 Tax=Alteriqipengyuania halimionae TaxID=1926630 RepID=A0A6I4U613_9SPHN|nr:hypothetical protein [Alteriqipengyuania halimionae]MXP10303.1 hypothetical protein [Alteriqipengyuania halimionae]
MSRATEGIVLIATAALLAGCGPYLGDYEVVAVELEDDLPSAIDHSREPEPYFRIDVKSAFDLAADTNGGVYPFMSVCPYDQEREQIVFGPVVASDPPIDLYDAGDAIIRSPDGMITYSLLVPVRSYNQRSISKREGTTPSNDSGRGDEDVCIQIMQAGYFLTDSRSALIRVSSQELRAALDRAEAREASYGRK